MKEKFSEQDLHDREAEHAAAGSEAPQRASRPLAAEQDARVAGLAPDGERQAETVLPHGPATRRFRFPTVGDLLALLGIFLVAQLVAWVVTLLFGIRMPDMASMTGGMPDAAQQSQIGVFNAVSYSVAMTLTIAVTLIYRRLRGGARRVARFSLKGFNPAILLWGLVMIFAAGVVIEPLMNLLPAPPDVTGRGLWAVVTVVVLAPVLEELLCRGIVLESLKAKYGVVTALWVSALFFAVMHLHVTLAVNAFVIGLILGFVYLRTESLYATILLHGCNNAVAMTLIMFGAGNLTLADLISDRTIYACVYVLALVVLALAAWQIVRTVKRLRAEEKIKLTA